MLERAGDDNVVNGYMRGIALGIHGGGGGGAKKWQNDKS